MGVQEKFPFTLFVCFSLFLDWSQIRKMWSDISELMKEANLKYRGMQAQNFKLLTCPLPVNNWLIDWLLKISNSPVTISWTYHDGSFGWPFLIGQQVHWRCKSCFCMLVPEETKFRKYPVFSLWNLLTTEVILTLIGGSLIGSLEPD